MFFVVVAIAILDESVHIKTESVHFFQSSEHQASDECPLIYHFRLYLNQVVEYIAQTINSVLLKDFYIIAKQKSACSDLMRENRIPNIRRYSLCLWNSANKFCVVFGFGFGFSFRFNNAFMEIPWQSLAYFTQHTPEKLINGQMDWVDVCTVHHEMPETVRTLFGIKNLLVLESYDERMTLSRIVQCETGCQGIQKYVKNQCRFGTI